MRKRQKARRVNNLNRSVISLVVGALFVALSLPVEAQQATKVYRVGFLSNGAGIRQQDEVLQKGLREKALLTGGVAGALRANLTRFGTPTGST